MFAVVFISLWLIICLLGCIIIQLVVPDFPHWLLTGKHLSP